MAINLTPGYVPPSTQTPFAAPAGYQWQTSIGPDGTGFSSLVPDGTGFGGSGAGYVPGITNPPDPASVVAPNFVPPQMVVTFDTIGQTIYSTMGHARMPLRYLWVLGVVNSGDSIVGGVVTFAAALCAPLDPLEDGITFNIYEGSEQVYSFIDGITPPASWDPIRQALLIASLATAVVYPGTEGQEPDPTILADKGEAAVSAYRGLRYIVLQDYPATSLPRLNTVFQRTNAGPEGNVKGKKKKPGQTFIAVEFAPGSE